MSLIYKQIIKSEFVHHPYRNIEPSFTLIVINLIPIITIVSIIIMLLYSICLIKHRQWFCDIGLLIQCRCWLIRYLYFNSFAFLTNMVTWNVRKSLGRTYRLNIILLSRKLGGTQFNYFWSFYVDFWKFIYILTVYLWFPHCISYIKWLFNWFVLSSFNLLVTH